MSYTGQVQGGWSPQCSCVPTDERSADEEETSLRDAAVSNVPANQVSNVLCEYEHGYDGYISHLVNFSNSLSPQHHVFYFHSNALNNWVHYFQELIIDTFEYTLYPNYS